MRKRNRFGKNTLWGLALLAGLSLTGPSVQADEAAIEKVKAAIAKNIPNFKAKTVLETPVEGVYQVQLDSGEIIHIAADGKHIFSGDLLVFSPRGIKNLTEEYRATQRVEALRSLKDEDLVVYPAKGEEKGEVIAFTDTSCGYCQKFHTQVPKLNSLGITVKYAAWPRYGIDSPAGQTMLNVWCSADRGSAMNKAKSRQAVERPEGECTDKPLQEQIVLGHRLGIRGTPALFLGDGRKIGGYRSAEEIAKELGL